MKPKLILASTSPRRHRLMQQMGLDFEIVPSDYEEDMTLDMPPADLAEYLARGKAYDVSQRTDKGKVIGIDTFCVLNNELLGKPKDEADAKRMLKMLSGNWVDIYSGVAIIDAETGEETKSHELTKLRMRDMTENEIDSYIATGEPMDKAGAFGIQGLGGVFIAEVKGCPFNIAGLPVHNLATGLKNAGVDIFAYERWNSKNKR